MGSELNGFASRALSEQIASKDDEPSDFLSRKDFHPFVL